MECNIPSTHLPGKCLSSVVQWSSGGSPKIAAKGGGEPTNKVSQSKGIAKHQTQTSLDRVVAALIAQIFTASDRSGSRQSPSSDWVSEWRRLRNESRHRFDDRATDAQ